MCLTATKRIPNRAIQSVRGIITKATNTRDEVAERLVHDILRALDCRKWDVHRKIQTTARDIAREAERTRNRCDYSAKKTRTAVVKTGTTTEVVTASIVIATIVAAGFVSDHFLF
jgi:hypothetical protein